MAEGIKNKVAIIGMGCTRFGEHWDRSAESLAVEAFEEAIADAGIEKKDIQAAWLSTCFDEGNVGKSAIPLAAALKLSYRPITRVENLCASGTDAVRGACYAVASGACDMALAVGVEKLKDIGYGGLPDFSQLRGIYNRPPPANSPCWPTNISIDTVSPGRRAKGPLPRSRPRATPTGP